MEYYIVMNEWHYPTNTGRMFVGDFDELTDAHYATKVECTKELRNSQRLLNALGMYLASYENDEGYILKPSDSALNYYFRSVIIKREML